MIGCLRLRLTNDASNRVLQELSELLSQRLDTGSLSPRALLLAADALASSAEEGIARSGSPKAKAENGREIQEWCTD